MSEPSMVSFSELELSFGYELFLIPDLNNKQQLFDCVLAGCIPEECLMVTAPASGMFPRVDCGQRVLVRIRLPSGVALFPTTILFISETPTLIVYLDYPRDIKFKRVRAARVFVSLPVLMNSQSDEAVFGVAGKIVDVSTSGARIEATERLGNVGDIIEVKGKFQVGNMVRMLSIHCIIRAEKTPKTYGVEFCEQNEEKLLVLLGFIYQSMAFNHAQAVI
ncbi:MAG TPA: PilZ domain-containing protein [Cellvibrionaceae bacterium]|nr:PilZ domain-containing protein [Cellvibrionaceae bacterium]HMW47465.1 PilZ domain-containing protein [Cellvibrionaceae bacterium]HMW70749.1 PilZ domain-containing protein [Cellvibrionaceae bacterium]HMY39976.1 PilZ domain-containing protein [Marinagarivorans sp.]HNG58273.1 PilZ domain-containing protein [Cellvibrionaceae bacterium]